MKNFPHTLYRLVVRHALRLAILFGGVLIPLLIFGKLADGIWERGGFAFDETILHFVHRFATPTLDTWIALATTLGGLLALPGIAAIIGGLRLLKQSGGAVFFILAVGGASGLNLVAKAFFQRVRPHLWQSPAPEFDYSFPSGHAMLSMAMAAVLITLAWPTRLRWPALVLGSLAVLVIGLSRLYLGVHFPSDVLAGWCASLLWVTGIYMTLTSRSGIIFESRGGAGEVSGTGEETICLRD